MAALEALEDCYCLPRGSDTGAKELNNSIAMGYLVEVQRREKDGELAEKQRKVHSKRRE